MILSTPIDSAVILCVPLLTLGQWLLFRPTCSLEGLLVTILALFDTLRLSILVLRCVDGSTRKTEEHPNFEEQLRGYVEKFANGPSSRGWLAGYMRYDRSLRWEKTIAGEIGRVRYMVLEEVQSVKPKMCVVGCACFCITQTWRNHHFQGTDLRRPNTLKSVSRNN